MSTWAVRGYTEERLLGKGASGRVVAAVSESTRRRVAIKYLSDDLAGDPVFMARFRAEAELQRSLDVPHIVQVLDYVEGPRRRGAAIVMELVDGVSLHEMITARGPASPEAALSVLKGSLLGLGAAHAAGIVHRDYKPENVLVDVEGDSKLADFGVAVRAGRKMPVAGTPLYMAPEQWAGAPNSPTTDIYAATAVFYECLTGKTPFAGRIPQLRRQHETAPVPVETVDVPLRAMIARGMAKNPADRPRDAIEFIAELEATAVAAYGAGWEERGRNQLATRVAALLLLLLPGPGTPGSSGTSTATYWAGDPSSPPPPAPREARAARPQAGPASRKAVTVAAIAAVVLVAATITATAVTLSRHAPPGVAAAPGGSPGGPAGGSPSAQTVSVQAAVTPPVAAGQCATTTAFTYQAMITAPAAATVSYQWVYSSGKPGPVRTMRFTAAAQQQVAGATVNTKTSGGGWAELRVTSPVAKTSNKAAYKLLCTAQNGITATALASPAARTVTCGTTPPDFTATGTITSPRAAAVTYYWALSDGRATAPATLKFTGPGTRAADPLSIPPLADPSSGAAVLVVTGPVAAASAPATYTLSCKAPPLHLTASAAVSPAAKTLSACTAAAPTFTFSGSITDNQAGPVRYYWSLPGGNGPVRTLQFGQPGTQTVAAAFTPGTDSLTGSGSLVVTSPGSVRSSPATFTLTCAGSNGKPLTINIAGAATTATVGHAYTGSFTVTGGYGAYRWAAAAGLPAGLTQSASGGTLTISGTPTQAGTFMVSVSVSDRESPPMTATQAFPLTIAAPPALQIATASLPPAQTSAAYAAAVTATGGVVPYTWTAAGLPAGLTIGPATGLISGTPPVVKSSTADKVTVTVSDIAGQSDSVVLSLTVNPPPTLSITPTQLPGGTVGTAYSEQMSVTGGTGPYAWTAVTLPAGLSINPVTGLISGTPTAANTSKDTSAISVAETSNPTVKGQETVYIAIGSVIE